MYMAIINFTKQNAQKNNYHSYNNYLISTVDPPIPPLSGLAKKLRYWKPAVGGVEYTTKKKHILNLEISSGIGGGLY